MCIRDRATDVWGLLMRKDSPLAEKNAVRPEDLKGLRILGSRQAVMRNELSGWYGGDFERLNIAATYNLIYNAALMVDEGFGYALCLDKLINTTGDSNLCFRPLEPRLEARLILVWKKYQVFSRAVQKFLERLPVSYTHLDVYKRQGSLGWRGNPDRRKKGPYPV